MARFRLHHHHQPGECAIVFAAWQGFASPLRHGPTVASCVFGGHEVWWDLDAEGPAEALGLLPRYVADRTRAIRIGEIEIP